jgi:hypothetical protein
VANLTLTADRSIILHGQAGVTEHLGRAEPEVKDVEVWAWMTSLVSPFDTITTPQGTFVVSAPARNASRGFFNQPAATEYLS